MSLGLLAYLNYVDRLYWQSTFVVLTPLVVFWVYAFAKNIFVQRLGRSPENVAFNFQSGLIWDRVFAYVVTLGFFFGTSFVYLGVGAICFGGCEP